MKSKISVNIDSELLDIIKDCSDSDLDSIIQDALAQYFGIKHVWVRADTLDPISTITTKIPNKDDVSSKAIAHIKRRRQPRLILKIWDKLKDELNTEFTTEDYWNATKKCDFDYKESARHSTILEHLRLIEEAGKIIKIGEKPKTYQKLELKPNEQPESGSVQNKEILLADSH